MLTKHFLTLKFYKENTACKCCRNTGHFPFCVRPFAMHRRQSEKDNQNVEFAPPWKSFWTPMVTEER